MEENRYRRYDASVGLSYYKANNSPNADSGSTFLTVTLSTENRKYINDKFKFVHGFFYGGGLSFNFQNNNTQGRLSPLAGYQLGVQYDINNQFYIGATTFPGVRADLTFNNNETWFSGVSATFSPTAEVSVLYRF